MANLTVFMTICFLAGLAFSVLSTSVLPAPLGRALGELPSSGREFALLALVYGAFSIYYMLGDLVGGVASARTAAKLKKNTYQTCQAELPAPLVFAMRAQMNQVEQFPFFLAVSAAAALLVNGLLAGLLSLVWAVLRVQYSRTYRANALKEDKGLARYTLPCYMVMGVLSFACIVHAVRLIVNV